MQRGEAWCFSPIFCFVGKQGKQSVKLSPDYEGRQSVRFSKSSTHFCCSMKEHPNRPWICMPDSSSTFPKAEDKSITEKSALYSRSSREKANSTTAEVWSVPSIPNCFWRMGLADSWKNSATRRSRILMLLPVSSKRHRFLACAFMRITGNPILDKLNRRGIIILRVVK